jgi:hypothetical protein
MRSMKMTALFAVAAVLFAGATLRAQTSNGQARGTITDATGGVLPGVTVTRSLSLAVGALSETVMVAAQSPLFHA